MDADSKGCVPLRNVGVAVLGGGYKILEAVWRIVALKDLGIPIYKWQTVSSAGPLIAKFIETDFNTSLILECVMRLVKDGPKAFGHLNELLGEVNAFCEYLTKIHGSGMGTREWASFLKIINRLKPHLDILNQLSILSHDSLYRLIREDLAIDIKRLFDCDEELQVITKNETRCDFTVWSTRNPVLRGHPALMEDIFVASMSMVPVYGPKMINQHLHSDGLSLRLHEFIVDGCDIIILFSNGQFDTLGFIDSAVPKLIGRAVTDFHVDINIYLDTELNYAYTQGYSLVSNNPDVVFHVLDLTESAQQAHEKAAQEHPGRKIILVVPIHTPSGLGLLGFPTTESFRQSFVECGEKSREEVKKFLKKELGMDQVGS